MKRTVRKLSNCRVEMALCADKDTVKKKYDEVYKHIGQKAKVPGFRPGKVPRNILEQRFFQQARNDVVAGLVEEVYFRALKQEGIAAVGYPEISNTEIKDGELSFNAVVEVAPDVKIRKYRGIKVKRGKAEVTQEKVTQVLEQIKKDKKAERLDDDFARSLGYPSLGNLEEVVRQQIFLTASENARRSSENQIIKSLLDNSELQLPNGLVEREFRKRQEALEQRIKQDRVSEDVVKDKKKEWEKGLRVAAERDLKVYFILNKIAKMENIEMGEDGNTAKVVEFLLKEAEWV
ncbi:MAG: trigger factor [Candidatus Omnitrophota bacterium]